MKYKRQQQKTFKQKKRFTIEFVLTTAIDYDVKGKKKRE